MQHWTEIRLHHLVYVAHLWSIRLLLLAVALLTAGFLSGYRINVSSSIPRGLYQVVAETAAVPRGSIVITCLPEPWGRFALQRRILRRGDCVGGT